MENRLSPSVERIKFGGKENLERRLVILEYRISDLGIVFA